MVSRDSTLKIGQPPIKAILPFVLHFHDKRLIHSLYVGSDLKVPYKCFNRKVKTKIFFNRKSRLKKKAINKRLPCSSSSIDDFPQLL
jgi:hypothetical protein